MKRSTIITILLLMTSLIVMSQTSVNIDLRSGVPTSGTVWGGCSSTTNIYTDDSNIARAAVHHYGLATGYQYTVTISYSAGLSNYYGCTKNGVTSESYGSWGGSYSFTGWSYYDPCTTPGTPSSASPSPTGTTSANLSWTTGSPAGSSVVTYYWEVYTSGGSYVTGSNTTSTSTSVSGLSANTAYYFRVRAYTSCDGTYSDWKTSSNFTTYPANPTSISGTNTICNGGSTILTAIGAQGTVYWYTGSCGGTQIETGNPITVSPTVATIYYVRNYNGQFSEDCASITINVEQEPISGTLIKTPNDESICQGISVLALLSPGSGGNGTDEVEYRTNNGTDWSSWSAYTSGNSISTNGLTNVEIRTRRTATTCTHADYNIISWTVEALQQFRTIASGNWTTHANWEQYNGNSWTAASSYPGEISNYCLNPQVIIQASHQMKIQSGSNINIPNLEIEATGMLTVKSGGKIVIEDQLKLDQNAAGAIVVE